jgi:hypothetical protein
MLKAILNMIRKAIWLIVLFFRFYNVSGECTLVLNELNIENGVIPESLEFIEFQKINCPITNYDILKHYFLIMAQEYDMETKSATIIFSANFIHSVSSIIKFFHIRKCQQVFKSKFGILEKHSDVSWERTNDYK